MILLLKARICSHSLSPSLILLSLFSLFFTLVMNLSCLPILTFYSSLSLPYFMNDWNVHTRSLGEIFHTTNNTMQYAMLLTVCVVDGTIFRDGDGIPTDDPCESCKCRPPGFSCVLRECEVKPGCKAIRREGECCPEYQCG